MKIRRNDKCSCGSGKKYKRCCIETSKLKTQHSNSPEQDSSFLARAKLILSQHQAAENVRIQQQGNGSPIISWMDETRGFRFVAVKTTLYWGKNWVIFPNFLEHFMKKQLGPEWGERERTNSQHPLFRWLQKTQEYAGHKPGEPKVKSIEMKSFIACWLHLAYALYLIAHHDDLPKRLLKRLREPITFMPAYHETIVGAALAVAGMEISNAETKIGSTPTPEYRAKSKATGKVYEIEAKRKDRWRTRTDDVLNVDFQRELETYVRDQIYSSSKKYLKNAIFWFELSIPTIQKEADWRVIGDKITDIIRNTENSMTVNGNLIAPAYVVITNHTFLTNEDVIGAPCFGFLQTIRIPDYPFDKQLELEAALEGYDKHRDIFLLMEAWKKVNVVPTTFDGSPPELLDNEGRLKRTTKIGDFIDVPDMDGNFVRAKIEDICSWGKGKAMAAVSRNGSHWLVEVLLNEKESLAAERFTDAVFGKNNASRYLRDDDPFDLYDWALEIHSQMTQEQLEMFFDRIPNLAHYKHLSLKEARVRVAREYTKWIWQNKSRDIDK